MPNTLTHYLCGLEAIKSLENEKCKKLILKHQNVFNLGTQGPDILFYHELWPWASRTVSPNIGQTMHTAKVNEFFRGFISYILKQSNYIKEILTVYFMGFLCHNCMDSIGHPYVFYWSGFKPASAKNENLYHYYHRRFETNIDVLLCKILLNKRVHEINHEKQLEISFIEQNIISDMYRSVIKSVYKIELQKKKIIKAIKDMLLVEKLAKDPSGIKRSLVGALDRMIFGFPLYSSIIFPSEINDGLDYLNLKNREWCMPYDNTIKSSQSFPDLFKEACERTRRFCDVLYPSVFFNNSSITYALKLFGNNSYTSGMDCDKKAEFKYCYNIFEKN